MRAEPRARVTTVPRRFVAWSCVALAGCVSADSFFFAGHPVDRYAFDEADSAMDGDLSSPHATVIAASLRDEGFVTTDAGDVVHWVFARQTPRDGEAPVTILFSHGNGGNLGRFWDRVELLWQLGAQVVVYDYPGFGRSSGSASEEGVHASARAVLEATLARPDVDAERLVFYGHSLGVVPTLRLAVLAEAGNVPRPRAVVSESGWCSAQAMIEDAAFLDVPREALTHLTLDNCASLASLRSTRVLLLHGGRDAVVSQRQLALLEDAASLPVEVHLVPQASHVDVTTWDATRATWADSAPVASSAFASWMAPLLGE